MTSPQLLRSMEALYDEFSVPGMSSRKQQALNEKWSRDIPRMKVNANLRDPNVRKSVGAVIGAQKDVDVYAAKGGINPVDFINGYNVKDDFSNVHVAPFFSRRGFRWIPVGLVNAYYNTKDNVITAYKSVIPGTEENRMLRSYIKETAEDIRETAKETVNNYRKRALEKYGEFLEDLNDKLSDFREFYRTLVHEARHHLLNNKYTNKGNRLLDKLFQTAGREGLEGENEDGTDEIYYTGEPKTENSYGVFKKLWRKARNYVGIGKTSDLIRFAQIDENVVDRVGNNYLALERSYG